MPRSSIYHDTQVKNSVELCKSNKPKSTKGKGTSHTDHRLMIISFRLSHALSAWENLQNQDSNDDESAIPTVAS